MAQILWPRSWGREFFRGSKLEKWNRYLTQLRFLKCLQHKSVNRLDVQSSRLPIAFHQATNWNRRQELQFQFLLGKGDSTIYGTSPVYLDESRLFLTFYTCWVRCYLTDGLFPLCSLHPRTLRVDGILCFWTVCFLNQSGFFFPNRIERPRGRCLERWNPLLVPYKKLLVAWTEWFSSLFYSIMVVSIHKQHALEIPSTILICKNSYRKVKHSRQQ